MSAIAIEVMEDGIIFAGDGVFYDYETGAVGGYISKLISLPHLSAVIGCIGNGEFGRALAWEIGQTPQTFDELVQQIEGMSAAVHQHMVYRGYGFMETEATVLIGGWSDDAQAYQAYRLMTFDKQHFDAASGLTTIQEAFTLLSIDAGVWCSFLPEQEILSAFGMDEVDRHGPGETAARLICACRASSGFIVADHHPEGRPYSVGGFMELVTLRRGEVHSVIAHRWREDVVGEPVDPSRGDPLPSWIASMQHEENVA